jgi:hypothetical protein
VLAERAQRGEQLFHPDGAKLGGDWAWLLGTYQQIIGQRHEQTGELVLTAQ